MESWFFFVKRQCTFQKGPHSSDFNNIGFQVSTFNSREGWQLCFSENRPQRIKQIATIVKKLPHFAPKQITLNTRAESQLAISVTKSKDGSSLCWCKLKPLVQTWLLKTKRCFVLHIFTLPFYRQEYRRITTSVPREECDVMLALKFTASNSLFKPSLYRKPLALRERIFACETVEGLARSFMSFKKYKS